MNRFVVAFLALTVSYSAATLGIDTISAISTSGFQCLRSNNYAFYIGRVGATGRSTRPASNIKNAHSGALEWNSNVDAYLFPCHSSCCGSAKQQVSDSVNAFRNGGAKCGTLWLDVEIYNWGSNLATNQQFILDMVSQCKSMGVTVGIYTNNNNNWQNVVGIDWAGVSSYPIWWANYNGVANFNNFKPFGGWSKPAIHQYSGDVKGPCSVGNVDMNWYP
ncbi:hypothetical protein PRIPAC_97808 [Pristionchus pacificus]|uniref:Uncharacterized protein n=1 Tax=Pristionchus pacificus TaxID=54126 RepID=A0A2A6D176_PRIPA|nr:hypothetical protein PRIPAC_97808 [Pristionchus pacificus]|eukprot:PDM84242.1 hypothetical protein PRIPAC_33265 [Pristionchus pacificus]